MWNFSNFDPKVTRETIIFGVEWVMDHTVTEESNCNFTKTQTNTSQCCDSKERNTHQAYSLDELTTIIQAWRLPDIHGSISCPSSFLPPLNNCRPLPQPPDVTVTQTKVDLEQTVLQCVLSNILSIRNHNGSVINPAKEKIEVSRRLHPAKRTFTQVVLSEEHDRQVCEKLGLHMLDSADSTISVSEDAVESEVNTTNLSPHRKHKLKPEKQHTMQTKDLQKILHSLKQERAIIKTRLSLNKSRKK